MEKRIVKIDCEVIQSSVLKYVLSCFRKLVLTLVRDFFIFCKIAVIGKLIDLVYRVLTDPLAEFGLGTVLLNYKVKGSM